MSISGSGLGDEIGGPRERGPRELEATAFVSLNKAALAIVADSIEISFTKFGGNLWKYEASASRPTLAPLMNARVESSLTSVEDKSWEAFYDQIVKNLPSEIAARMIKEKEKAKEDRNVSYVALEEVLVGASKILSWIHAASIPDDENSVAARNSITNFIMATTAGKNLNESGRAFFNEAREFLELSGSNNVYADQLSNHLTQAEKELNRMETLMKRP